jgi:hypothetical protein
LKSSWTFGLIAAFNCSFASVFDFFDTTEEGLLVLAAFVVQGCFLFTILVMTIENKQNKEALYSPLPT